jgi:hypothetical protein
MTSKTKMPERADAKKLGQKQPKSSTNSRGIRRDYLMWAWEFLRRNAEYRVLYRLRFDAPISMEERLEILSFDPVIRALPIELFDANTYHVYGDTFGTWLDMADKRGIEAEINVNDILDPKRFCLTSWIDPACDLPENLQDNFDPSMFELDEVWAMNFKDEEQSEDFLSGGPSPRDFECSLGMTATKPTQVALKFDLRLPLDAQLAQAERQLTNAVQVYKDNTERQWHEIPDWEFKLNPRSAWPDALKLLDEQEKTSSKIELFRRFTSNPNLRVDDGAAKRLEPLLKTAESLREFGYRLLILKGLGDFPARDWRMKKRKNFKTMPPYEAPIKERQSPMENIASSLSGGPK